MPIYSGQEANESHPMSAADLFQQLQDAEGFWVAWPRWNEIKGLERARFKRELLTRAKMANKTLSFGCDGQFILEPY